MDVLSRETKPQEASRGGNQDLENKGVFEEGSNPEDNGKCETGTRGKESTPPRAKCNTRGSCQKMYMYVKDTRFTSIRGKGRLL